MIIPKSAFVMQQPPIYSESYHPQAHERAQVSAGMDCGYKNQKTIYPWSEKAIGLKNALIQNFQADINLNKNKPVFDYIKNNINQEKTFRTSIKRSFSSVI